MMKQYLFLMLGYPGSGKSTFAKQLVGEIGAVRLSSDELRKHMFTRVEDIKNVALNTYVFGAIGYAAETILQAGYSATVDANCNRLSDRTKARNTADTYDAETVVIWIQTPLNVAKQRENQRQTEESYLAIPEARYDQLVKGLQEPSDTEKVIVIDGLQSPDEQLTSFREQFAIISQ